MDPYLERNIRTRFRCPEASQVGDSGKNIHQLHHVPYDFMIFMKERNMQLTTRHPAQFHHHCNICTKVNSVEGKISKCIPVLIHLGALHVCQRLH